jgi:hypothetical protein
MRPRSRSGANAMRGDYCLPYSVGSTSVVELVKKFTTTDPISLPVVF